MAGIAQILVNERQKGNPLLQFIRNVSWEYNKDIIPDYVVGQSACALFLSVKYHLLHQPYIFRRIKEIGRDFRLRVVLVFVDIEDNLTAINELNKICFSNDMTIILCWSNLEAARYLETLKSYENKGPSSIQEREETEFLPRMTSVITKVKSVNKTDVVTLLEAFDNLRGICQASEQQLMLCPGLGEKKVRRLYKALHQPFKKSKSSNGSETLQPSNTITVETDKYSIKSKIESNDDKIDKVDLTDDS